MSDAADDQLPVKIAVQPSTQHATTGSEIEFQFVLQDAQNDLAKAPKELPVVVEFTSPSGRATQRQFTFKPHDTSTTLAFPIDEVGVFSIRAMQAELLDDDTFVFGVPGAMGPSSTLERRMPADLPTVAEVPPPATASRAERPAGVRAFSLALQPAERGAQPEMAAMPEGVEIQLRHRPQRRLLANGIDAGTIFAYLVGGDDGAAQDVKIHLFNSQGNLIPAPLIIPSGEIVGSAILTSEQAGEVTVSYVQSIPHFDVIEPREVAFSFQPPVVQYVIRASPSSISLLESADISVELQDADRTPIAVDHQRQVALIVEEGHGELSQNELNIPPGRSLARTSFTPTLWGTVRISGSTPDLLGRSAEFQVTWPIMLLAVSVVGGLLGGIADYRMRRGRRWPIVLAIVTGFLLFWGLAIGLIDVIPRNIALNPISTFAVSFIGGVAGSDVIKLLLRRFGLPS